MKLAEIAVLVDAELVGNGDTKITGLGPIETAAPGRSRIFQAALTANTLLIHPHPPSSCRQTI